MIVFSSAKVYLSSWSNWPPFLVSLSACSFPWIPQCAGIYCRVRFVWAAKLTRSFHLDKIFLAGNLECVEDRASISEDDHTRLSSG